MIYQKHLQILSRLSFYIRITVIKFKEFKFKQGLQNINLLIIASEYYFKYDYLVSYFKSKSVFLHFIYKFLGLKFYNRNAFYHATSLSHN